MPANRSVENALKALESSEAFGLGVNIGGTTIKTGQYFKRSDAQQEPQISFNVPDRTATYTVVALDLDAPFQSWTGLGPILHWIQPGLKVDQKNNLVAHEPFVANWIGPAPPPGSGPHRYSFYLFHQPSTYKASDHAPANGAKLGNFKRMWFDLDKWIAEGSFEAPIAANYFTSN